MWRDYTIKSLLSKIMAVGPLLSAKLRRTATADGDEILHRVADRYPELIFSGMIKLAKVTRIEVGSPGDFAKLGKQAILETL